MVRMALGGLATARRGITTQEGEDMANNKVQLDRKKADANKDGKVSKYEELSGEAKQRAMVDDPDQDEKVLEFQSGGTAMTTNTSGLSGLNLSHSLPDTTSFLPYFVQESLSDLERHKMNILGVVPPYILNLLTARELNSMPESLVSESLAAARRGPPKEGGVQEVMDKEGNPIKRPDNKFEREPFPYNYTLPLMDRANLLPEEMSDKDKYPDRYPSQTAQPEMSHGGIAMMDEYGEGLMSNYDPVSGNPIPLGSSAENVRDDIDAKISTDEYVLPAHVVKWHGLKHIMEMQSEAEMGLMSMDMSGLIQEVESDTQEEPDSEGVADAEVSDAGGSEQEEEETLETPEGNKIEVAGVETTLIEPEVDETEDYKENKYGKSTGSFGIKKNPSVAFIMQLKGYPHMRPPKENHG